MEKAQADWIWKMFICKLLFLKNDKEKRIYALNKANFLNSDVFKKQLELNSG